MNNSLRWLALFSAVIGMGVSMPSCPGQQAMQQQIDSLQSAQAAFKREIGTLHGQVENLSHDNEKIGKILEQMTSSIKAQESAIAQLDQTVKGLAAAKSSPAKVGKKKR